MLRPPHSYYSYLHIKKNMKKNYVELEYNCTVTGLYIAKILRITLFFQGWTDEGKGTLLVVQALKPMLIIFLLYPIWMPRMINDNFVPIYTKHEIRYTTDKCLLKLYSNFSHIFYAYVCH